MQLQELVTQGDLGVILFAGLGARKGTTGRQDFVGCLFWSQHPINPGKRSGRGSSRLMGLRKPLTQALITFPDIPGIQKSVEKKLL